MGAFHRLVVAALPFVPRAVVARVARRYIAGETVDSAVAAVRALAAEGCGATVDVLGEFITRLDQAEATAADYRRTVAALRDAALPVNVSVKLTAFGLLLDEAACERLVEGVAREAAAAGGFLRVDMEDSPCTDRTLRIHDALRARGLPVGVVLQARLLRTPADAARLAAAGAPVRLCKGIYLEPAAIAHTGADAIRAAFLENLEILLRGRGKVAIATHDAALVRGAEERLARLSIPRERYEFQMLLGVLPELRRSLVAKGHPLRVYVPYGTQWYAYSTRRLRENPEVAGHILRAMLRPFRPATSG
jgi:proline dehydrogenase